MSKSAKGGRYERELAVKFSLWWSNNSREDLFWRTGGSGGRAKVRGKQGRRTDGQHGDLSATDESSQPVTRLLTIELKRGYSKHSVADMLDKSNTAAIQEWEKWLLQVKESYLQSGSFSWILVQKRDRREAIVFFPHKLHLAIKKFGGLNAASAFVPYMKLVIRVGKHKRKKVIHCTTLDYFLIILTPPVVHKILRSVL